MSSRLEMLQVARLSRRLLGPSADNIRAFLDSQLGPTGFHGRDGTPDLYYSVFGVDCLHALQTPPPAPSRFRDLPKSRKAEKTGSAPVPEAAAPLASSSAPEPFRDLPKSRKAEKTDSAPVPEASAPPASSSSPEPFRDLPKSRKALLDLACLARLSAGVPGLLGADERARLAAEIEQFRGEDGGFSPDEAATSTVYASFLALGALQDLSSSLSAPEKLVSFIHSAARPDGGFSLGVELGVATTPTTAAAVSVLHQLGARAPAATASWLAARAGPQGGFVAAPGVVVPDLLSTAVALHALVTLQQPVEPFREACLDFVDTLWSSRGGFYGHWADDVLDCEYLFYGLLALGHLA